MYMSKGHEAYHPFQILVSQGITGLSAASVLSESDVVSAP